MSTLVISASPSAVTDEVLSSIDPVIAVVADAGRHALRERPAPEAPPLPAFKLASRALRPQSSEVPIAPGVTVGGRRLAIMAGPGSVESREQMLEIAAVVKAAGATVLRGGAFRSPASPYAFQGLQATALKYLAEAGRESGLPVVTEVEPGKIDVIAAHADMLTIGGRNIQDFALLKRVAEAGRPVLLERGTATTIQEWLLSAEYLLAGGNPHVILCERGIATFETATPSTLDLNAIPVVKKLSHLPVVVNPCDGTGSWQYVEAMALAAIAAGADGVVLDVHPRPDMALSDGAQSLKPARFAQLMTRIRQVAAAVGREV
jgi:3-deoxy-7-phosphoheptulonate synthase